MAAFITAFLTHTAAAEPSIKELLADRNTRDVRMIVNTAGQTLRWVNARLREEGKPLLFCEPPESSPTVDAFIDMIEGRVEEYAFVADEGVHTFPRYLLDGLVDAFPCVQ